MKTGKSALRRISVSKQDAINFLKRIVARRAGYWNCGLFLAAMLPVSIANEPVVSRITVSGASHSYEKPYLLDFNFSLRDQNNRAVIVDPAQIRIVPRESTNTIDHSESGLQLHAGDRKLFKCFLVLDYSLSMADPAVNGDSNRDGISDVLETVEASAKTLIERLYKDAQIGIYEFHREDPDNPPARVSQLTVNKSDLSKRIDSIWRDFVKSFPAGTRSWDAVYAAIEEFPSKNLSGEQRFVVFLSDGNDESSQHKPADVIQAGLSKGVKVFAIGYGRELKPEAMQQIARETGGQYYTALVLEEIAQRYRQVTNDLLGQYILRWTTLRRPGASFTPSFEISLGDLSVTNSGPAYLPSSYSGDALEGRLFFETLQPPEDGSLTLALQALYVPRFVTELRFNVFSAFPFSVEKVRQSEGGICPDDWLLERDSSSGWIRVYSPNPGNIFTALPFASMGKLLRFKFANVTDSQQSFIVFKVENSVYQGG